MLLMAEQPRLGWTLALSAGMHLLLLVVAARLPRPQSMPLPTHVTLIPVTLIGKPGGGANGGAAPAAEPVAPPAVVAKEPVPPPVLPHPAKQIVTRPKELPKPRPVPPTPAVASRTPAVPPERSGSESGERRNATEAGHGTGTSGEGTGGGRPGTGGRGSGTGGGEGGGDARVAYAANPRPEYPVIARRMGMEGVVLLSVLVRSDGGVGDIDVQKSSGFSALDDAALRTVRSRWRFVPARKAGEAVDARVTVPIRFQLADEG